MIKLLAAMIGISSIFVLSSCRHANLSEYSEGKALIFDKDRLKKTLMPKIFSNSVEICVESKLEKTREQQIERAIKSWISPLRALTDKQMINHVVFSPATHKNCRNEGNWALKFDNNYDRRAHFNPETRRIRISPSDNYNTILHEFGHAFGLYDTYDDDIQAGCKLGQPHSVMCPVLNTWYFKNREINNLLPDDIIGVRAAFCKYYDSEIRECSGVTKAGRRKYVKNDGSPILKILAKFKVDSTKCTNGGILVSDVNPSSTTYRSGLRTGMCLKSINLQPINKPSDVQVALSFIFSSFLNVKTYSTDGGHSINFLNADIESRRPDPQPDDIVFVYRGSKIVYDDGYTWEAPSNLPCQVRARRNNETRVGCHRLNGWALNTDLDLIIENN